MIFMNKSSIDSDVLNIAKSGNNCNNLPLTLNTRPCLMDHLHFLRKYVRKSIVASYFLKSLCVLCKYKNLMFFVKYCYISLHSMGGLGYQFEPYSS